MLTMPLGSFKYQNPVGRLKQHRGVASIIEATWKNRATPKFSFRLDLERIFKFLSLRVGEEEVA